MKIERVTRYEVDGKEFQTLAKAQDHIDGLVNKLLTKEILALPNNMMGLTDIMKLTEIILDNRQTFAYLLSVELPEDDE